MKFLKRFLCFLWKVWFYVLVAIITVLLSPFLLILSSKEEWYPQFYKLGKYFWAYPIMYGVGVFPKVIASEKQQRKQSYMYVANHTSMLDIMLMLIAAKEPFVFVGKVELSKMPIFGFFYKRVAILVDRSDAKSRHAVYESAQKRLDRGFGICIFPEGRVPEEEIVLDSFRDGAFRLAIQYQIPIVPMTFPDNKKRFPFSLKGSPGISRAIIHSFIQTKGIILNKGNINILKEKTRQVILSELENS